MKSIIRSICRQAESQQITIWNEMETQIIQKILHENNKVSLEVRWYYNNITSAGTCWKLKYEINQIWLEIDI